MSRTSTSDSTGPARPRRRLGPGACITLGMALAWSASAGAAPQATRPDETSRDEGELRPGRTGLPTTPAVVDTPPSTAPMNQETPAQPAARVSSPASAEIVWEKPTPPVPDLAPRWVPTKPSDRSRSSADAGALEGVRVLSIAGGVARVQLPAEPAPRSLRVGDRIGTDTVVRVEAARVVLTRPAGPDEKGDATVVLKAGRDGLGFVRVYRRKDPVTPGGGASEAR